jgi:hypothetical protein
MPSDSTEQWTQPGLLPDTGHVQWKMPLPTRGVLSILATDNQCFVGTSQGFLAFNGEGHSDWVVDLPLVEASIPLPNHHVGVVANDTISILLQGTGACVAQWDAPLASTPIFTHIQTLAYTAYDTKTQQRSLYHTSLDGTILWTKQLSSTTMLPPASLPSGILVADGYLYQYSFRGELQQIASYDQLWTPGSGPLLPVREETSTEQVITPLLILDAAQAIVGFRWEHGSRLVVINSETHQVRPILSPLPFKPKVAVVPRGSEMALVHETIPTHHGPDLWEHHVALTMLNGTQVWQRATESTILALTSDRHGKIALACSPSPQWWDTYNPITPLMGHAYIECLQSDGVPLWRWEAPGPITSSLAAGPHGCLYVVADGNLYCLG